MAAGLAKALWSALMLAVALCGGCKSNAPKQGRHKVNAILPGAVPYDSNLLGRLEQRLKALPKDYKARTKHVLEGGAPKFSNRLLFENSPYLRQHAHNPVNWFPWSEEAFAEAKRLKRPVLLSVGYATCHWCHVMEEESFEDIEIAKFINTQYIAIKVDREERPDIDGIYMTAVQAISGHGGWPMTVWLTPEAKPFFGGTYFPPRDGARGAHKGFLSILEELRGIYQDHPERAQEAATQLASNINAALSQLRPGDMPAEDILSKRCAAIRSQLRCAPWRAE